MTRSAPPLPAVVRELRSAGCVFAEDEARLLLEQARTSAQLTDMLRRRVAGLPLEQVLGWAEFRGLRIVVQPGVFVPRRRTGFLVEQALRLVAGSRPVVVDLCCGSGAVGAALEAALERVEVHAADVDAAAVRCARHNLDAGRVHEGDLFEALPRRLRGRVDLLVVNAPYVPTEAIATMPPEARVHEPLVALDGGPDGLAVQRRVLAEGPRWLSPGGHVLIETSEEQAGRTAEAFAEHGLAPRVACSEELSATVVVGSPVRS